MIGTKLNDQDLNERTKGKFVLYFFSFLASGNVINVPSFLFYRDDFEMGKFLDGKFL